MDMVAAVEDHIITVQATVAQFHHHFWLQLPDTVANTAHMDTAMLHHIRIHTHTHIMEDQVMIQDSLNH